MLLSQIPTTMALISTAINENESLFDILQHPFISTNNNNNSNNESTQVTLYEENEQIKMHLT